MFCKLFKNAAYYNINSDHIKKLSLYAETASTCKMITISKFNFQVVTVPTWTIAPEILATTATASPSPARSAATATRASTAPTVRSTSTSAPGARAGTDDASTLTDRTSKISFQKGGSSNDVTYFSFLT